MPAANTDYTPTIGIECHVQLNTASKLFVGVDNDARDASPNTLISPLCTGMPGSLPVLNEKAVELAIKAGLALNAKIAHYSKFDRKHYFYPDLPLGYQITQYDEPIVLAGSLTAPLASGGTVTVRIHHAHLEADAGKSTHPADKDYSLVDLNRAGTPLLEIVSEPDMHTPEEAKAYARELYLAMKYAGVSDVNLFYGNMRFDVNVSVSSSDELGTRTETKNLNSFRAVEKAVEYEIARQIEILEAGGSVVQETRGWDDAKQATFSQRSKEDAHDYRYFPDPDLPPVVLEDAVIDELAKTMPTMPYALRSELIKCGLDPMSAEAILDNPDLAWRWNEIRLNDVDGTLLKKIGDWFANDMLSILSSNDNINLKESMNSTPSVLNGAELTKLAKMTEESIISSSAAKSLLAAYWSDLYDVGDIAKKMDLLQVSDESELQMIVQQTLTENPKVADDIKAGEMKAIGFVVGNVMKATGGKANPGVVQKLVRQILGVE